MEFCVLFVLFAHSFQGLLAGPPVEVAPERIILLENRPLEVKCRVRQPIAYCRFDVPGIRDGLSLRPGIRPHQGIQYLGAGLEQGECGMLIQGVSSKHSGIINCSMGFNDEATESKGSLTLIVAKPPDPPILEIYPNSTYKDFFREGEVIQANCRIINARPVANISWYLGAEPIYDRLGPTVIKEENGFSSISQNITRKVTYLDHGKDLKCVAGHIALGQGNINHSIYKLNVHFPPKPKSQELEKFGFTIGQPGKIVVTFQANPIPVIVWKVDQENLKQGTRDRTGRFEAGILQHKGAGTWDAVLLINSVRPEEVEKRYTLIAQNELGQESYKVAISTSPEPPVTVDLESFDRVEVRWPSFYLKTRTRVRSETDITAGTIVGIVIAVLVILLLVFILIFARATGRWCFAAGTNGKKSSSEVAIEDGTDEKRPPSIQGKDGVYSSTEYINGNDKKCSDKINTPVHCRSFHTNVTSKRTKRGVPRPPGESRSSYRWFLGKNSKESSQKVNSLIYKDYTLVEYEDGTKSYVSPEEKSQLLLEKKLKRSKTDLENEIKMVTKGTESDSDSGYEVPVARDKPKSCDVLDKSPKLELKRNSSFPFSSGEMSPGDNGRINLPPYVVPLETSLTFPITKQKQKDKKKRRMEIDEEIYEKREESSSPNEADTKKRFSLKGSFWPKSKKKFTQSPEDAGVKERMENSGLEIMSMFSNTESTENKAEENVKQLRLSQTSKDKSEDEVESEKSGDQPITSLLNEPIELFPENLFSKENEDTKRYSLGFNYPKFPNEPLKRTEGRLKNKKLDPNPLRKMFGVRGMRKSVGEEDVCYMAEGSAPKKDDIRGRYDDASLSQIQSDTESADHGSADKSSVSKLTSEKQPKKLMSGLFGSFRKGRNKDKLVDNEIAKNPSPFEIAVKEQPEDIGQTEIGRTEGIVYAELDMARSPGNVMRREDEKTEYAEIIYPGTKLTVERSAEEFRKSRENLNSSRENLTEVDEAFSTTPDGKKEAAV